LNFRTTLCEDSTSTQKLLKKNYCPFCPGLLAFIKNKKKKDAVCSIGGDIPPKPEGGENLRGMRHLLKARAEI